MKNPKQYLLVEFPYPSGDGLHVGHVRSYTAMDIVARKRRRQGYDVLFPMGWDALGLPTENYAVKTGIHPKVVTKQNTDKFRAQMKALNLSFDWDREVNTTDPKYYKWTQWIFLQLYKNGLAYKKKMPINWCPVCKVGLANEEVTDGKHERCGTVVVQKEKEQWMLAITKYADRLYRDLDKVDYLPEIKTQQRNWIGPSAGALIKFALRPRTDAERTPNDAEVEVFTTRPDTIFGVTFLAVSTKVARERLNFEHTFPETEEKLGVDTGVKAVNPANGEEVPVWVVNYVLPDVGTGAIMGVPAHDERDFEFAKKYNLSIKYVIAQETINTEGDSAFRPNDSVVKRNVVRVILKHWSEDKILVLHWNNHDWQTFVSGGIEDNEDIVSAAKREIAEETGFLNPEFKDFIGSPFKSRFFAPHKNQNREDIHSTLFFQLKDDQQNEISQEEHNKHSFKWVEAGSVKDAVSTSFIDSIAWQRYLKGNYAYVGEGILLNSEKFTDMKSEEARVAITEEFGKAVTTYKLRDWIFSRQRYWGEPIPIVYCEKCGEQGVPEEDLPVELPDVPDFKPRDDGQSPLANVTDWVNTKCPKCGGPAKRETDVMPNWAGSSWYYLAYIMRENPKFEIRSSKPLFEKWLPVDWYNGGMEHVTLHLLYSRFWHKFLFDIGVVPTDEPYAKRTAHGLILGENGEKMSKSRGNVVNPDDMIARFGADALRLYEMFMGPFDQAIPWSTDGLVGTKRFLERVERLSRKASEAVEADEALEALLHKTIKQVSEDIENMKFNTAVSAMMILANEMDKLEKVPAECYEALISILGPFAPETAKADDKPWPIWDENKIKQEKVTIMIQINGKTRDQIEVSANASEEDVKNMALNRPKLVGIHPVRVVYVPNRLINIVT